MYTAIDMLMSEHSLHFKYVTETIWGQNPQPLKGRLGILGDVCNYLEEIVNLLPFAKNYFWCFRAAKDQVTM